MGIKDIFQKLKHKDEVYKQLAEEDKARAKIDDHKLTADEKALAKYIKREHDEAVREKLNEYHKKQEKEYWKKDVISQKNLFNGKATLLKQKNIFKGTKGMGLIHKQGRKK